MKGVLLVLAILLAGAGCGSTDTPVFGGTDGGAGDAGGSDGGASCGNSLDCATNQVCDPATHRCVECLGVADCPANNDCADHKCVPFQSCTSSLDCPTDQVCDPASARCVQCVGDADCNPGETCAGHVCRTGCQSDLQCTPQGLLCDMAKGYCVECITHDDCTADEFCSQGACKPDVCQAGTSSCQGTAVVTCDDVGSSLGAPQQCQYVCLAGACSGVCAPGAVRCSGQVPETCDASGQWAPAAACPYVCSAGSCIGTCTPGEARCSGQLPETCDASGNWQGSASCPYVCSAGACTGSCQPGAVRCSGLVPQSCDASGQWQDSGAACAYVCAAGACSGVCTPGSKECNGVVPRTCSSSGQWQDGSPCSYLCSSGVCTGSCTPGSKQCSGKQPQSCDSAGTWQNAGSACQYVCDSGACTGVCTPGSKDCNGKLPRTCDASGQWQSGTTCQYLCIAGACSACSPGTKRCSGLDRQTCDSNGQWQTDATCTNPHGQAVCTSGACAPVCDADYDDCDGNLDNGCEASLQTDSNNCKSCGTQCGSGKSCVAGTCKTGCVAEEAVGGSHACARKLDGTAWCWGLNSYGQIGVGNNTSPQPTPLQVTALGTDVASLATGDNESCAAKTDGTLWCWGQNTYGEIGDGTTTTPRTSPVQVTTLGTTADRAALGTYHACALDKSGSLWCWGYNYYGQVGDGTTTTPRTTPVKITSLGSVVGVALGSYHSCAVKTDHTLWCWGYNYYGAVGDGSSQNSRSAPVQATSLGANVAQVSAGSYHTCAVKTDHTLWCWGYNNYGQLGDGTTTTRLTPVQITSLGSNVASVAAGYSHTCVLKTDNTLWCWGYNYYGQVGDGTTTTPKTSPVQVALGASALDVTAGGYETCARQSSTALYCWGSNGSGQVGDGATSTARSSPTATLVTCP